MNCHCKDDCAYDNNHTDSSCHRNALGDGCDRSIFTHNIPDNLESSVINANSVSTDSSCHSDGAGNGYNSNKIDLLRAEDNLQSSVVNGNTNTVHDTVCTNHNPASSIGIDKDDLVVIDVNYFPSYKEVPDFPRKLRRFFRSKAGMF